MGLELFSYPDIIIARFKTQGGWCVRRNFVLMFVNPNGFVFVGTKTGSFFPLSSASLGAQLYAWILTFFLFKGANLDHTE